MSKAQDRNPFFGERLKKLREAYNLSQTDLGEELGVPAKSAPNVIGSWEKSKREPNFNMLVKITKFFGVSTDYLLGVEKQPSVHKDVLLVKSQNLSDAEKQFLLKIIEAFKDIDFSGSVK